jgi:hypothetical protein
MAAILIVEDDPVVRKQLVEDLAGALPGVTVESGEAILPATEKARLLRERDRSNHLVAVLDVRLPLRASDPPTTAGVHLEQRRELLRALGPGAVVFNITAFPNSLDVQTMIDAFSRDTSVGKPVIFPKARAGDKSWDVKLVDDIKGIVYSRRVEERLAETFRPVPAAAGGVSNYGDVGGRDVTRDLGWLAGEIEEYWPNLSESVREQVRRYFRVRPQPDGRVLVEL